MKPNKSVIARPHVLSTWGRVAFKSETWSNHLLGAGGEEVGRLGIAVMRRLLRSLRLRVVVGGFHD